MRFDLDSLDDLPAFEPIRRKAKPGHRAEPDPRTRVATKRRPDSIRAH